MATSSRLLTHKWRLLPDFWSTMGFTPRRHRSVPCTGFTPSVARFIHNNIISKEVCRVFVLWCHSASHLTCFISFHRVHLSYAIMQSYSHTVIQVTFIHTFIQLYIHTSILSHVHTQHIHNINSYKFALVVQNIVSIVSFQFGFYLSLCQAASFNKWTSYIYLFILFQAASPKQQTAWVYLPFYLVSSRQS